MHPRGIYAQQASHRCAEPTLKCQHQRVKPLSHVPDYVVLYSLLLWQQHCSHESQSAGDNVLFSLNMSSGCVANSAE